MLDFLILKITIFSGIFKSYLSRLVSFFRCPNLYNGNPLQYSCLENPIDRGAWHATVHGVARVIYDIATKPPPHQLM